MYNNSNLLTWYTDSKYIDIILSGLSFINYTTHIFLQLFFWSIALGALGMTKKNYMNKKIVFCLLPIAIALSLINKEAGYYLNIYGFFISTIGIIIVNFLNLERKSLKWISSILISFVTIVLLIYMSALYLVVVENDLIMETFSITNYNIYYKPFLEIYRANDVLMNINYQINSINLLIDHNIIYKRIYIHYYFLNTFLSLFWFTIYIKVLKIHGIKIWVSIFCD